MTLLEQQIEALFISDQNQRLRWIREPGYVDDEQDPAPRFFMTRSAEQNLWRFRADLSDEMVQALTAVCKLEPIITAWQSEPVQRQAILQLLDAKGAAKEHRGPAYTLLPQPLLPTQVLQVTEENIVLLEPHFPWKRTSRNSYREYPMAAVIVDGKAVSICYCARITKHVAEAGVDTSEAYRGKGYAVQAVQAWANEIHQHGLQPLYSTDWRNMASRKVASKLGAQIYAENWSIL